MGALHAPKVTSLIMVRPEIRKPLPTKSLLEDTDGVLRLLEDTDGVLRPPHSTFESFERRKEWTKQGNPLVTTTRRGSLQLSPSADVRSSDDVIAFKVHRTPFS